MIINKITKTRKYIKGGRRNGYIPHIKRKLSKLKKFITPRNKRMKEILKFANKYNTTMTLKANTLGQYQRNLNSRAEPIKPLEGYELLHELAKEERLQAILKRDKNNYMMKMQGIQPPVNRNSKRLSLGPTVINSLTKRRLNVPNNNSII